MEKIIFGITGLTLGGAERVLVDLSNKLAEKYDITIFTLYAGGELEKELDKKIHLKSLYNFRYDSLSKIKKKLIPLKVLFTSRSIFKKYVANEEYKAQIAFLEGPITQIFKYKSSAKKIAWIHNDISSMFSKNIKAKIKRIFARNAYEKYDNLVFVSMDNLDKFNKIFDDMPLPKEKVIKNYINSERILKLATEEPDFNFNKDEINIVQVSRLVEQKAINRLIDVHANLIKQGIKHHVYVVGTGPLKEKLQKQIEEQNVAKTFTLLGPKENPYPYIKNCDAFCLLSNYEGYGMVIDEAKILNKFICITNTAAREALLDYPGNSRIVQNNEEGIEDGIKYIVKNKQKIASKKIEYHLENDKTIEKICKMINL